MKAADVRAWLLQVALNRRDIEGVVVLVERGASMREASITCFKALSLISEDESPFVCHRLPLLIAAAHWAGRVCELSQDLNVDLLPLPRFTCFEMNLTFTSFEITSETVKEVCADAIGTEFLHILVRRGAVDDKARIEFLLRSGVTMPYDLFDNGKFTSHTGIKVLYQLSCKAGRDAELLKILEDNLELILTAVSRNKRRDVTQWFQAFRDGGLLGPLALSLRIALFSEQEQIKIHWDGYYENDLEFLKSIEELFKEYEDADRRYAQFLETSLSQRTTGDAAKLITSFHLADPANAHERRCKYDHWPAYTWKEFEDYYGSYKNASWHWPRAGIRALRIN